MKSAVSQSQVAGDLPEILLKALQGIIATAHTCIVLCNLQSTVPLCNSSRFTVETLG